MSYKFKYTRKGPAQKFTSFIGKATLTLAFAAAVAGFGYGTYGTRQNITAKVLSVDVTSDGGHAPKVTVHTDKGTFVNQPTRFYNKSARDAELFTKILKAGKEVKLAIYGITFKIGDLTQDDIGWHQNILRALPATNEDVAATVAALIEAPPVPDNAVLPPVTDNRNDPEVCVSLSNPKDVDEKSSQIDHDLTLMARLPLTGAEVCTTIQNPANDITACVFPVPEGYIADSQYQRRFLAVARTGGTTALFHESFHAMQDINGGENNFCRLTARDAVIGNLLTESAAVAYELVTRKEASSLNFEFTPPSEVGYASTSADNVSVFNAVYDRAMQQYAGESPAVCQAKALEVAGQEIVRRLMNGEDIEWRNAYVQVATRNVNQNLFALTPDRQENENNYIARRQYTYLAAGKVSSQINLIPPEYVGQGANTTIDKCFRDMGFTYKQKTFMTQPATKTPAAPKIG